MLRSLVLLGALAALTTGCNGNDDPVSPTNRAQLRVVHVAPDAPALDVLVEGVRLQLGLGFEQFFGYNGIPEGERRISLNITNTSDALVNVTEPVSANTSYSIFVIGLVANASIQPLFLTDDRTPAGADLVKLRVVNAAPEAGTLDFYVTGPTVDLATVGPALANVAFAGNGYVPSTPAGAFRIRATPTGTKDVIIDTGSEGGVLQGGQVYTAVALDTRGGGAPFQVRMLVDSER